MAAFDEWVEKQKQIPAWQKRQTGLLVGLAAFALPIGVLAWALSDAPAPVPATVPEAAAIFFVPRGAESQAVGPFPNLKACEIDRADWLAGHYNPSPCRHVVSRQ